MRVVAHLGSLVTSWFHTLKTSHYRFIYHHDQFTDVLEIRQKYHLPETTLTHTIDIVSVNTASIMPAINIWGSETVLCLKYHLPETTLTHTIDIVSVNTVSIMPAINIWGSETVLCLSIFTNYMAGKIMWL